MGACGRGDIFWIVASADGSGANVLAQRIRERLERNEEAKAGATFRVSVAAVQLPSPGTDKPLEDLVEEVADVISGMVLADIGSNHRPDREAVIHKPQLVAELKRRKNKNGQTKNPYR
jgi:hypothetical protein